MPSRVPCVLFALRPPLPRLSGVLLFGLSLDFDFSFCVPNQHGVLFPGPLTCGVEAYICVILVGERGFC